MNQELKNLIEHDSLTWANEKKLSLRDGYTFSLSGLKYLIDIIDCKKKIRNCKKGAQMCLTTAFFIDSVHACKYRRYNQNIMYMMPTVTAVERLSKVSFDPILDSTHPFRARPNMSLGNACSGWTVYCQDPQPVGLFCMKKIVLRSHTAFSVVFSFGIDCSV